MGAREAELFLVPLITSNLGLQRLMWLGTERVNVSEGLFHRNRTPRDLVDVTMGRHWITEIIWRLVQIGAEPDGDHSL